MSEFLLIAVVPVVVGFLASPLVPRASRHKRLPLIVAPFISAIVVCGILFAWDVYYRSQHPNSDSLNQTPAIMQSIIGTMMYAPAVFLFGAIPAATGAYLFELCAADFRKRSSK